MCEQLKFFKPQHENYEFLVEIFDFDQLYTSKVVDYWKFVKKSADPVFFASQKSHDPVK